MIDLHVRQQAVIGAKNQGEGSARTGLLGRSIHASANWSAQTGPPSDRWRSPLRCPAPRQNPADEGVIHGVPQHVQPLSKNRTGNHHALAEKAM